MAKVEFTSSNWVEYRDSVNLADRFAVAEAMKIEMNGPTPMMAVQNDARNALLGRLILGWSYEVPIPSQNSFAAADMVIASAMSLDDYDELSATVEPLLTKLITPSSKVADPKKRSAK
jgi:hypothetical protein